MIKDRLYNYFVRKNENVRYEYERYVVEHIDEHDKKRFNHWKILWLLNWHYCVRKKTTPYICFESEDMLEQSETGNIVNQKNTINASSKPNLNSNVSNKEKVKSKYLPYLDGAESRVGAYTAPADLVRKLMQYDVISFDVFDTLLFRPFGKPRDLFHVVGERLGILDFQNIRSDAEDSLKEYRGKLVGTKEITLYDIYEEIHYRTGIDISIGMKTEIEAELEFCFANPYMKYIFETMLSNNKRIVIVTDMYLEAKVIESLLEKNGYTGYEKLFVSCEYSCSKRSGKLYDAVIDYLGKDVKIIHIGDNEVSDIEKAREKRIDTFYYENVNKSGNKYRAIDMSIVVGSAYKGIVNTHLHNGFKRYDAYYEFGYIYGGLFSLGYCNWIYQLAKQKNTDKILFVARDGYLLKQVYERVYGKDIKSDYVFWSRIVGLKLCSYKYKNDFMKEYVYRWIRENKKITFREVFENMELLELASKFHEYTRMSLDDFLTQGNQKEFVMYIESVWQQALAIYDKKSEAAKKYISGLIKDCKRVCIVDIGWRGQGALALKSLIEEKWMLDCDIYGTVAASAPTKANSAQLAKGIINSYMFSPLENIDCFKFHSKNAINNVLTELLVGAPHPSLKSIQPVGDSYEFVFDVPEISNYPIMEGVHKGIKDFVEEYFEHFKNCPYMFNISGHDAYMPIMYIFKDYRFMKKFFGRYEFQDFVGGVLGYQSRTIKDVFNKFKL